MKVPMYFYLWAKTESKTSEKIHPLIYHLLDVGECTLALWNYSLSYKTRKMFCTWLGLEEEPVGRLLAFLASTHDIGKAAPGFQARFVPRIGILRQAGFVFPARLSPDPVPHGIVSTWALKDLFQTLEILKSEATYLAVALGGHHGTWPLNTSFSPAAFHSEDKGDESWTQGRKSIFHTLVELYQPPIFHLPEDEKERNVFLTLLSGLVSVADWIGSMTDYIPFMESYFEGQDYIGRYAHPQAAKALEELKWIGWKPDLQELDFSKMFSIPAPNAIQQVTFSTLAGTALPVLLILEAPTGIGKTETALYLADRWLQNENGRGMYVAMPTTATSNQMYERVTRFLEKRYPHQRINSHLVHGKAFLQEDENPPVMEGIAPDQTDLEGGVKAETWFQPRKRTLLAPFGVGTVDQALLSVLQTRHFFVRLFGLGQKVVIFDEVHAYDTYMSTLFQSLLAWLHSIGTSVILLSATLSQKTRRDLVAAWLGNKKQELPDCSYPRLTWAAQSSVKTAALPVPPTRNVFIRGVDSSPDQIAQLIFHKLQNGGNAAIICNRVKRAQEIYEAVLALNFLEDTNLILFHARFPYQWREDIEKKVLSLFGKDEPRPQKALVIATQVIEQSLDLDFDFMVSDLAPVDLLIQRAGRLHRHSINDSRRPPGMEKPVLALAFPSLKDGLPDFGQDAYIYDADVLLKTWSVLQNKEALTLPGETVPLIEAVYGDKTALKNNDNAFLTLLQKLEEKSAKDRDIAVHKAKTCRVPDPDDENLLTDPNAGLEEDDGRVNDAYKAFTRLGETGLSIICLHRTTAGIALDPDGRDAPLDLDRRPSLPLARKFLNQALTIQRRDVLEYLTRTKRTSAEWRKSPVLRDHIPINFENGIWEEKEAPFIFKLDRKLGLLIIRKEGQ